MVDVFGGVVGGWIFFGGVMWLGILQILVFCW